MASLKVGQEDLKLNSEMEVKLEERLVQVVGHLFKYDAILNKNIPVKEGLFLCVDKAQKDDGSFEYLLNVVDQSQEFLYCRSVIRSETAI